MKSNIKKTQSAGGVVVNKEGLFLIVNQNRKSWSLPKGHIDKGESALEAAKREIYEESGVNNLELLEELGSYERYKIALDKKDDFSELKKIFMFLFQTEQSKLSPVDPMNPEARWCRKEEIVNLLTHQKDKDFFLSVVDKINKVFNNPKI
ncbi:MAG: NUDIX domain-containing protein [archaeon]